MKNTSYFIALSFAFFYVSNGVSHAALYTPVPCDSQAFFGSNSCDLCYEERTPIVPGEKLEGLYDTWQGQDINPPIVYEDEQVLVPIMINIAGSGTTWSYSATDPTTMWQLTPDIPWTMTGVNNRKVVTIPRGTNLRFIEQKPGTFVQLDSTNRNPGDILGMMKFPLIYRYIDPNTDRESDPIPHFECVTYRLGERHTQSGIVIVPPTNTSPQSTPPLSVTQTRDQTVSQVQPPSVAIVSQRPTQPDLSPTLSAEVRPADLTSTQTGPLTWILALISALIGLVLVSRKKIFHI